MGFRLGGLVAIKILSRGRGAYIILITSSLLLYYPLFLKNPQITDLLIVISILNASVAVLADVDSHNSIFYAFRVCGAITSEFMTYILVVSALITTISSIPVIASADIFKISTSLLLNILVSSSLLHMTYIKVKKYTV